MTTQHTPAQEKFYIVTDKTADDDTIICVCRENPSAINENAPERPLVVWQGYESEQNWVIARLIAAAPDLLEALEAIFNGTGMTGENMDLARAAIAKARGQ